MTIRSFQRNSIFPSLKLSTKNVIDSKNQILDCHFDVITKEQTVSWVHALIKKGGRGCICTVNVAILMMMGTDERLRKFVDKSQLIVADGQPIVWFSRFFGKPLPERVAGIDLVDELASLAEQENYGIYLLGATEEVILATAKRLQAQYPRLRICGVNDGYFSLENAQDQVQSIRDSQAQILLVGMGVPRQEYFLDQYWADLGVNVAIGVGGSFDVIAGVKRRAPQYVQDLGLEWLYRLYQEPGRLWKRYLTTNTQFLFKLAQHILKTHLRFLPS